MSLYMHIFVLKTSYTTCFCYACNLCASFLYGSGNIAYCGDPGVRTAYVFLLFFATCVFCSFFCIATSSIPPRMLIHSSLSYNTLCCSAFFLCIFCQVTSFGNLSSLIMLASSIALCTVLGVGVNVMQSKKPVLDIPSLPMATVLANIWMILNWPICKTNNLLYESVADPSASRLFILER